jgi:hypothetical protein
VLIRDLNEFSDSKLRVGSGKSFKLKDRRNNHNLVLFHKMNYNKTPQYLVELIPKTVGTRHTHNTRQINNIVNINCRTSEPKISRFSEIVSGMSKREKKSCCLRVV